MMIPFAALSGATIFWTEAGKFLTDLFDSLASGILFFGGPLDIVRAVVDILVTTFVVFLVLRLMRDSRAWQLVKGIILILVFAQLCVLLGLTTVGYLLGNTLSVLAIAFVVLFQPELRRALETVGRGSLSFLAGTLIEEDALSNRTIHNTIEEIVRACDRMSASRTGALIVLERETRMSELAEQENSVVLDSAVSSAMLLQIFYKGSPLHDGAVLIRNGRILAARCHIPLSDNLHLRRDYGTRHRAAVGASEMGDAIAVVVSEERGTISISFEGRLYTMENTDALRILLHKLLGSKQPGVITNLLRGRGVPYGAEPTASHVDSPDLPPEIAEAVAADQQAHDSVSPARTGQRIFVPKKGQVLMLVVAFVVSSMLWFYVQVTTNPVETRLFTVPLVIENDDSLSSNSLEAKLATETVSVSLMGRRTSLENLPKETLQAWVDLSGIETAGSWSMEVQVRVSAKGHFRVDEIAPVSVTVAVASPQEATVD